MTDSETSSGYTCKTAEEVDWLARAIERGARKAGMTREEYFRECMKNASGPLARYKRSIGY